MGQHYHHLSAFERNFLQTQLNAGCNPGQIALALGRSRSTVSREVRRNAVAASPAPIGGLNYDAGMLPERLLPAAEEGLSVWHWHRPCVHWSSRK